MEKKYGYVDWPTEYTRFETFLDKLEDFIQTLYMPINYFLDKRTQKVKVRIDPWDTWSMDHTLAPIILPMLVQLKKTKHGAPFVDNADVPKELRATKKQIESYGKKGDVDPKHFDRWDWVLDEMIYAFDCKANKDDVYMRFDIDDRDGMKQEQERISNGFRLFGKYYENLWD
jgi:hypothetical protein